MTPAHVWKSIGGYQANSIYGSDDGGYAGDCYNKKLIMAYAKDIYFEHPLFAHEEYVQWKWRAAFNKLEKDETEGYFEDLREEAETEGYIEVPRE
jgi:hypothetical protein